MESQWSTIWSTGTVDKEITGTHCQNDGTYHYHGQRKLPQFVVDYTDYTIDGANLCANAAQELKDLGRPTLETDLDAVNRDFDNITKHLKHGRYIESTVPYGETDVLHFQGYKRSDEHGWVYGNHPKATEKHNAEFQDTLVSLKACFAYSMTGLPGYNGPVGPLTLPLLVKTDIVECSRRSRAK
jgi:hypothetical protein